MDSALNRESATAKAAYLINCLYKKERTSEDESDRQFLQKSAQKSNECQY